MSGSSHVRLTVVAAAAATALLAGCAGGGTDAGHTGPVTVTVTASAHSSSTARRVTPTDPTIPMGAAGSPRGGCGLRPVNAHDSTAVAVMVATVTACWDTALDKSPVDGERRAAPLLTPELARVLSKPLGGNGGAATPGWSQLVAHHGWMTVKATLADEDGVSPDTATHAAHEVEVVATGHGKGWTGRPQRSLELVNMTRAGPAQPWRVTTITPVQ